MRTLTFRAVVVSKHEDVSIEWRRWGAALLPYSAGSFEKSAVFHVFPGDLAFRVDLKPPSAGIELTIEPLDE